jgi:hypothetical protein
MVDRRIGLAMFGLTAILLFPTNLAFSFSNGQDALLIIGQAGSFTTNTPGISQSNFLSPRVTAFDSSGNLWVADTNNNRVLEFPAANLVSTSSSTFGQASVAIGQPSLASGTAATSQTGLNNPLGIAIDSSGNLWVADTNNDRVLEFVPGSSGFSTGQTASLVFGQSSFTSNTAATSQSGLNDPEGIAFDSSGNSWVADSANNRVLEFSSTTSPVVATGTAQIAQGSCGISLSPTTISYTSPSGGLQLISGQTSTVQSITISNTGNVAGTVQVQGTDWLDSTGKSQMTVGNTHFSATSPTSYSSMTALSSTPQFLGSAASPIQIYPPGSSSGSSSLATYWELQANLENAGFAGATTQSMTFTTVC